MINKFGESTHFDYFLNNNLGNDYNEKLTLKNGDMSSLDFYVAQWNHGLFASASMLNKNRIKPFNLDDLQPVYPEDDDG